MFINYKREIYALAHLNLLTASFKCLYNICCFNNSTDSKSYMICRMVPFPFPMTFSDP